jgi:CHAT domain-containing protein/Flp pilus assembly protein TadD
MIVRTIFIILLFSLTAIYSCRHDEAAPQHVTQPTTVPDSLLAHQLRTFIDTTYDFPERVTQDPDAFIQQLHSLPATAESQRFYTLLLINMGFCLKDAGQVLNSIRYFEKALDAQQQYHPEKIDVYNYITKPLGNLYTRTGDFAKAISLQEMSIRSAITERDAAILPSLYNNLAITFQQTGQTDSALHACRQGLALQQQPDAVTGLLYTNISRAFRDKQQTDSAILYNARALNILQQGHPTGDSVIWASAALELKSRLAAEAGNYNAAEDAIQRAIIQTERHFPESKQREKAKLYEARAAVRKQNNRYADAEKDYRQVLQLFGVQHRDRRIPDNTVTDALHGLAACYRAQGKTDTAIDCYVQAIENDYLVQQLIVSKESNYYNSQHARSLLYEASNLLWHAYEEAAEDKRQSIALQLLWITELSKGRQLLLEIDRTRHWQRDSSDNRQAAFAQLRYLYEEIALEKDSAQLRNLKDQVKDIALQFQLSENYFDKQFSTPQIKQFKAALDKSSATNDLISWLVADSSRYYTFTCRRGKLTAFRSTDTTVVKQQLPVFIQTYFRQGPTAYDNDPSAYRSIAARLLTSLIPDAPRLSSGNWIISPDGLLYGLPVDALISNNDFLALQKNCSYTYTLLLNTLDYADSQEKANITIFSKTQHARPLPDLPYAGAEQKKISRYFNTTVKENEQATEAAFLEAMNRPTVLHIATHAVADSGQQPYLVLSQPITLDKLQYTTTQCPLVFLSACQTASGKLITAEGMESLNKAFLSKGVKGVVAAQWQVDDAVMPQLSEAFYKELHRTHNPVKALAQAKRSFLQTASLSRKNPWYWAPLNYTGVETNIFISQRYPVAVWVISGVLIAGALFLLIMRFRSRR